MEEKLTGVERTEVGVVVDDAKKGVGFRALNSGVDTEACVFCHEAADTVVLAYQFEDENGVNQIYALEDDIECIYESFL